MIQSCLICFEDYCSCAVAVKSNNKPQRYMKKPLVVEAIRLDMNNPGDAIAFIDSMQVTAWESDYIKIETLEGDMIARHGDYIIKGTVGEFYPIKSEIFEDIYEVLA